MRKIVAGEIIQILGYVLIFVFTIVMVNSIMFSPVGTFSFGDDMAILIAYAIGLTFLGHILQGKTDSK